MLKFYILILLSLSTKVNDPSQPIDQLTLKALYIERFTRFIEWPNVKNQEFFKIEVIGDNNFSKELKKIFSKVKVKNKPALIINSNKITSDFKPNLIYVSKNKQLILKSVIKEYKTLPVLIISEGKGVIENGCMIGIYKENRKLKFEINEKQFAKNKLYISYRLMQVAERIIKK